MSLPLRTIYDASSLSHSRLYENSNNESILFDCSMSRILGAFHQLIYLNSYAIESFDNLIQLSQDINERLMIASEKTNNLLTRLTICENRLQSYDVVEYGHSGKKAKEKYLNNRESYIPSSILNRNNNCNQILSLYQTCNSLPQFWRLKTVNSQDTTSFYSDPSFFFHDFIKREKRRLEEIKNEKKKQKQIKKQNKLERKNLRQLLNSSRVNIADPSDMKYDPNDDNKNNEMIENKEFNSPKPNTEVFSIGRQMSHDMSDNRSSITSTRSVSFALPDSKTGERKSLRSGSIGTRLSPFKGLFSKKKLIPDVEDKPDQATEDLTQRPPSALKGGIKLPVTTGQKLHQPPPPSSPPKRNIENIAKPVPPPPTSVPKPPTAKPIPPPPTSVPKPPTPKNVPPPPSSAPQRLRDFKPPPPPPKKPIEEIENVTITLPEQPKILERKNLRKSLLVTENLQRRQSNLLLIPDQQQQRRQSNLLVPNNIDRVTNPNVTSLKLVSTLFQPAEGEEIKEKAELFYPSDIILPYDQPPKATIVEEKGNNNEGRIRKITVQDAIRKASIAMNNPQELQRLIYQPSKYLESLVNGTNNKKNFDNNNSNNFNNNRPISLKSTNSDQKSSINSINNSKVPFRSSNDNNIDDDDLPPLPNDKNEDDIPSTPPDDDDIDSPPPDEDNQPMPTSALNKNILSQIKLGDITLKKAPPVKENNETNARNAMLMIIKSGNVNLKKADEQTIKPPLEQEVSIAQILAVRRTQIQADSSDDSEKSDSEFSDDDYG